MMTDDCNNPKGGQFNSMDRLSDLPDFILHRIISYLDTEEAHRTSVLSKRWNQIFATNPILDFLRYYYIYMSTELISRYLESIDNRMQKFSKENLRITTFKLGVRYPDLLLDCKVDEWLEIAVCNQVAEIELRGPCKYKVPSILFCVKSLRDLHLDDVEIPYFEAVNLVSLESLSLCSVVVEERMLFHIVSSCPLLKKLVISFGTGFKNIVIPRHSKLEYLHIRERELEDRRVVIVETSSLRSFNYGTSKMNPWPIISNRSLLRNLGFLCLHGLSTTGEDLAKLLRELTSLEKLVFRACDMLMTNIKISHRQLKQICFDGCYNLLDVVIDAPNLEKFKFKYYYEMDSSLSIAIRSEASCNIHVHKSASYFKTDGFFKLKKLLRGLNSCNVLRIFLFENIDTFEDVDTFEEVDIKFDEEESGNAEIGPPCDIVELKLNMSYCELSSSSISAFLNGLFWTCHPRIITFRVDTCHKWKVEAVVNKLEDMVKCLKHPLKRIQVEETNNDDPDFLGDNNVQLRLCW